MARKRVALLAVSDLHVGSTVALCPPTGIALEDGGRYEPNIAQKWIWEQWLAFCAVAAAYKRSGWKVVIGMAGEFVDGNHHDTTQIASPSPEIMRDAAIEVMQPLMKSADRLYVARGTEAHVGHGAASDYAVAKELGAVRDPETGRSAAYHWRLDIDGVVVSLAHHVSGGMRQTTRGNNIRAEMQDAILAGVVPDIMIRGHVHTYVWTGDMFRPRQGVVLPAWKFADAHTHRLTRIPQREVGGVVFEIEDGRAAPAKALLYRVPDAPAHPVRFG